LLSACGFDRWLCALGSAVMQAVSQSLEIEVVEKAKRRGFTAEYKQRVLEEIDRASQPGEIGAILRREGLYSSVISAWRRLREAGELSALTPRKRGPVPKHPSREEREIVELKRALAKSEARLKRAEGLLDLQKKVSEILGIELPPRGEEP
jgi:transposase